MEFDKQQPINLSIIHELLKLSILIYNYNKDLVFDLNQTSNFLLKNIDFDNLNLSDIRKNILIEIFYNSPNGKLVHFYDNSYNDMQAGITISHSKKRICVIFRGSTSKLDWLYNFKFFKIRLDNNIKVHSGFYNQLTDNNFCDNIIQDIQKLLHFYKDYTIYVSGHSMGGALATLFGYFLSKKIENNITVITFASPRVGNRTWYEKFNFRYNLRHYRVINNRDIVSSIPYISYYHVGNTMLLHNSDYYYQSYVIYHDYFYKWFCYYYSSKDHALENYYTKIKYLINVKNL